MGGQILSLFSVVEHWIAFGILFVLGLKFIFSKEDDEPQTAYKSVFKALVQTIATSIDAFAVGLTFSLIDSHILFNVILIGTVVFVLSVAGVALGRYLKLRKVFNLNVLAGSILYQTAFNINKIFLGIMPNAILLGKFIFRYKIAVRY